jgi:hypothetical protein
MPPFEHGLLSHLFISLSHLLDVKPAAHTQTKLFCASNVQLPPFKHGDDKHADVNTVQLVPL